MNIISKSKLTVIVLGLFFSSITFAQSTSNAGAVSGANSDATVNNTNYIDPNATATGTGIGVSNSSATSVTGDSHSSSGASAVSGDSSAVSTTGPSSAEIGAVSPTQTTIINSEAPHIPTPAPNFGFPQSQALQMFAPPGISHNQAGLKVTDVFDSVCPARAISGIDITQKKLAGNWFEDEVIQFVPHMNHVLHESGKNIVQRAGVISTGTKGYYKCVGIITAIVKPGDSLNVSYAALRNKTLQLITRDIRGYEEVNIFIASDARVVVNSLGSQGFTLGIGGGGSTAPQSMFIGGASGASYSNTNTLYKGVVGFTAVAFAPTTADDPEAVYIAFADEKDAKNDSNYTNGVESGKKNVLTQ